MSRTAAVQAVSYGRSLDGIARRRSSFQRFYEEERASDYSRFLSNAANESKD